MSSLNRVSIVLIFVAASCAGAVEISADAGYIVRTDGSVVPVEKITRDDFLRVSGVLKGGAKADIKSCDVADVLYPGRDANFLAAIEKRDAGRFTLAAMYFKRAAETLPHEAWVDEQCNFGIGEALYQAGLFAGYKGRDETLYAPASHYYQFALQANPNSRLMPLTVSRLAMCFAEERAWDKAAAALADGAVRLKEFRDKGVREDSKFVALADHAQARLALAEAFVTEGMAGAGKGKFESARDAFHAAALRSESIPELHADAVNGELRVLLKLKDYSSAKILAERLIEKFRNAADENKRTILAGAYLALGKCQYATASDLALRGQNVQAAQGFADARWAFLHVVAEYFDEDENVAAAHYFSGLCYDRLNGVESDAGAKARREWRTVVEKFGKSEFKEMAEKELNR